MEEQVKEEKAVPSPRERREQEQVDGQLRHLLNKLLNVRMVSPDSTMETLDLLEKDWFKFCIKPIKVGLMGSAWKKVRPNKEAFRNNAMDFIERFDKAQEGEQLDKAPEVSPTPLDYKYK